MTVSNFRCKLPIQSLIFLYSISASIASTRYELSKEIAKHLLIRYVQVLLGVHGTWMCSKVYVVHGLMPTSSTRVCGPIMEQVGIIATVLTKKRLQKILSLKAGCRSSVISS